MEDALIIKSLLKEIYRYYPVGTPSVNSIYKGQDELKKISKEKANRIIDKKDSPWNNVIDDLWESLQTKISAFVNQHSGQATIIPHTAHRPDWLLLKKW